MRAARPARLLVALTMAGVLLVAAGCSSSSNSSATTTTGKTEVGDAATVSSTTAPATTAPVTTAPPPITAPVPVGLDTPKAAAERLYSAWKANDRAGALTVADPVAVDAFFAAAPGDYRLYSGCDTGEFSESGCLYRGDAGTIQVNMEKRNALWVVANAFYAAN